ncbi:uncharacterized protein EI90DRAFT_3153598 [Cantharellus anzutake]|uniref:uncharacterized protein n=1 Tax=Cantharellus anzutake TaxID=1750568 RepID=UPI001907346A|nr:uncharacterized protein EI90DRAFT_3153598 [Cantharellus anzutake]KAF8334295.1 hypothetical protein EI90DRAFT_3153598 [Cantharellus anzutake]
MAEGILSLLFLLLVHLIPAIAKPCVVFDVNWNLYAFGVSGGDYNLGAASNWIHGNATRVTGGPPFDGLNTQCYLAQYFNAIYVINADKSNPSDIHIFNPQSKSWTTQKMNAGGANANLIQAILDHDTNVFYGLVNNTLYSANFASLTAASGNPINWDVANTVSTFSVSGYDPVLALAQNHIFFFNVPGSNEGSTYIFVIHFSYFQPQPQPFTPKNGNKFPVAHGKATSFFSPSNNVQEQIAFIPDDGSAVYVLNVQPNTTVQLQGPIVKDSNSDYAASTSELVQLTSSGNLYYLPYNQNNPNSSVQWVPFGVPGFSGPGPTSTSTVTSTGSGTNPTNTVTNKGSASSASLSSNAPGSSTSSKKSGGTLRVAVDGSVALGWFLASVGAITIRALLS